MLCNCISINIYSIYNNYDIHREFFLEKIRLQTLYCTDSNKLEAGYSTAGSTIKEHILQSQEADQENTGEFLSADWRGLQQQTGIT